MLVTSPRDKKWVTFCWWNIIKYFKSSWVDGNKCAVVVVHHLVLKTICQTRSLRFLLVWFDTKVGSVKKILRKFMAWCLVHLVLKNVCQTCLLRLFLFGLKQMFSIVQIPGAGAPFFWEVATAAAVFNGIKRVVHKLSLMSVLQRWAKRWTCFAKQQPGRVRRQFLAT